MVTDVMLTVVIGVVVLWTHMKIGRNVYALIKAYNLGFVIIIWSKSESEKKYL